jgi:hypothetical protein
VSSDWYARVTLPMLDALERSGLSPGDQLLAIRLRVESSQALADGYVSGSRVSKPQATRLVTAGVLHRVTGGYTIVGFHATEPSAEAIRAKRDQWRQRQQRHRQSQSEPSDSEAGVTRDTQRDTGRDVTRESQGKWLEVNGECLVGAEERSHKGTARRVSRSLPKATHRHLCALVRATLEQNPAITADALIAYAQTVYDCDESAIIAAIEGDAHADPWTGPAVTDPLPLTARRTIPASATNPFDEVLGLDPADAAAIDAERIRDAEVLAALTGPGEAQGTPS